MAAGEMKDQDLEGSAEAPNAPARKPARKPKAASGRASGGTEAKASRSRSAKAPASRASQRSGTEEPAAPKAGPVGPLQAAVVDTSGRQVDVVSLSPERFGAQVNVSTLHLAVRAQQALRRSGTASTKTRGEVSGTTAKMFRQKGTGRARAGSGKSPLRPGGGIVFGPHPRGYAMKVNRKQRKQALAMALSSRADVGSVFVLRDLELDAPSTALLNRTLVAMDIAAPVLVLTADEPQVSLSARNLAFAETVEVGAVTTEQVLRARSLVFTEKAFAALEQG